MISPYRTRAKRAGCPLDLWQRCGYWTCFAWRCWQSEVCLETISEIWFSQDWPKAESYRMIQEQSFPIWCFPGQSWGITHLRTSKFGCCFLAFINSPETLEPPYLTESVYRPLSYSFPRHLFPSLRRPINYPSRLFPSLSRPGFFEPSLVILYSFFKGMWRDEIAHADKPGLYRVEIRCSLICSETEAQIPIVPGRRPKHFSIQSWLVRKRSTRTGGHIALM